MTPSRFPLSLSSRLIAVLTGSVLGLSACVSADKKIASKEPNQVFVLGSLHTGMLSQPHYSLREFVGAIDAFKPDMILTEARMNRPGPMEGSVDGGVEQSIVYAYGSLTNVPVQAVNWFAENQLDLVRAENAKEPLALKKKVAPLNAEYEKRIRNATFLDLQSDKTTNLVRRIYTTYEKGGSTLSLKRNNRICENVKKALENLSGKRVVIVFGLDHKYALEDCAKSTGAKVNAASSFLSNEKLARFVLPDSLKQKSVENIKTSGLFLQQELKRGRYKGPQRQQLEAKLSTFPDWIEAVNSF